MKLEPLKNYIIGNKKLIMVKGFTLIELLVGITIFSLIIGAIIGILVSGIELQRRSLLFQEALNQLSFAIEYMNRALRMARKDDGTFNCLSSGLNYENPAGVSTIRFINHLQGDDCQEFFLEGNTLKYKKGIGGSEEIFALTGPNIEVSQLKFLLSGESEEDNFQPRVTILLKVESPLKIELQTTVSQRNLDVKK